MNVSTFRYSGLVHTQAIGVVPSVDKKGVIFVYKKAKKAVSFPSQCLMFVEVFMMKHNSESQIRMTTCPLPQTENISTSLRNRSLKHPETNQKSLVFCRTNQLKALAASPSSQDRSAP